MSKVFAIGVYNSKLLIKKLLDSCFPIGCIEKQSNIKYSILICQQLKNIENRWINNYIDHLVYEGTRGTL